MRPVGGAVLNHVDAARGRAVTSGRGRLSGRGAELVAGGRPRTSAVGRPSKWTWMRAWRPVYRTSASAAREHLESFAAELLDGFFPAEQRRRGQVHMRGPLLDGPRKSVEPMAARPAEDGNRARLRRLLVRTGHRRPAPQRRGDHGTRRPRPGGAGLLRRRSVTAAGPPPMRPGPGTIDSGEEKITHSSHDHLLVRLDSGAPLLPRSNRV